MSKEMKNGKIMAATQNGSIIIAGLKCQTDFLSKSELFSDALAKICSLLITGKSKEVRPLIDQLKIDSKEEIELLCTSKIDSHLGNPVSYYLHHDKRKAAVVQFIIDNDNTKIIAHREDIDELGKILSMHVVAFDPAHLSMNEVNWNNVDLEIPEKMKDKPANILEKIAKGKKEKYGKEHVFLKQPYVKDLKTTVGQVIDKFNKEYDLNIKIEDYCRMEV